MLVTTEWMSHEPRIVYQKYGDTYNFPIFRKALLEMRRHLWQTDEPVYVIIDYTSVEKVRPFSMMRGGVMIENARPTNAILGVAVARKEDAMYHYSALWLKVGRAIGSKAARDFHLVTSVDEALQIISHHNTHDDDTSE